MKYITIATDISNNPRYKVSTWACYIRHEGGVIKESGRFKEYYPAPPVAETYALLNALVIARKNIPDWHKSKIIIYNEIEHVLRPSSERRRKKPNCKARSDAIDDIALPILKEAYDWERRKIKAHYKNWRESDNPKKYAINRWCDQEARRVMRTEANKIRTGKTLALK